MSKLAVANIIFETTESNRIEYTGNNVVRVRANGGIQIPFGTTAQRASPEVGLIRFNTDTNTLETYETAGWLTMPTGQFISAVFGTTNVAFNTANAAFASANNVAPQVTPAYTTANLAYALSNTIYASVNSNWTVTNTVYGVANAAFASANNVAPQVTPAFNTANAAFAAANTKLSSSGGTISGDLVVTGNATFSGLTTYANTQTLLIGDNILTLNADLPVSVAATEDAGITVNRGLSGNASFIWDETTDEWDLRVNNNTIISIVATGNVGIGQTTTPERFGVFRDTDNSAEIGRAHIGSIGYNDYAGFSHVDQNGTGSYALLQSATGQTFINSTTGNAIFFRNNNTDKMILDASGNLGIGTTAPLSQFHVANNSYSYFTSANTYFPQVTSWNQAADAFGPYFILQKTRAASGVGAAVAVNDYLGTLMFKGYDTSGVAQNSSYITGRVTAVGASSVDSALNYLASGSTGFHTFNVNAGEAMRITATGNVGIGTAVPRVRLDITPATSNVFSVSLAGGSVLNNFNSLSYASSLQHNDLLLGNFRDTNGYSQTAISFGHTIDPLRKLHIGSANNAALDSTTKFLPTITITSGQSVGIGNQAPGYKLDVAGTVNAAALYVNGAPFTSGLANTAATVFLGSANTTTLFNGASSATFASSIRANRNITGGGDITYDSSANVYWNARFIVIANGRGTNFSLDGYFDINLPTSGTVITGVGGASSVTATASGIPLATWTALYYILPIGSGATSLAANFRVVTYTSNIDIPHDWVLICVRNGDDNLAYFNNGVRLSPGSTSRQSAMSASLGAGGVILENRQTIAANYTMTTNYSGMSAGPITINTGVSVTIPTGSNWVIV